MSFGEATGEGLGTLAFYAGNWPTAGGNPGLSTVRAIGQQGIGVARRETENGALPAKQGLVGFLLENWLPFTSAIFSRFLAPRAATQPWQSPFDLDTGLRITRFGSFPSVERSFPYPYEIGAVSNFMPMLDQYSMAWAWGKTPSGPGVLSPIPIPFQASYPNLQKVTG